MLERMYAKKGPLIYKKGTFVLKTASKWGENEGLCLLFEQSFMGKIVLTINDLQNSTAGKRGENRNKFVFFALLGANAGCGTRQIMVLLCAGGGK